MLFYLLWISPSKKSHLRSIFTILTMCSCYQNKGIFARSLSVNSFSRTEQHPEMMSSRLYPPDTLQAEMSQLGPGSKQPSSHRGLLIPAQHQANALTQLLGQLRFAPRPTKEIPVLDDYNYRRDTWWEKAEGRLKADLSPNKMQEQPLLLQTPKTKPFHTCQNNYFDIYETCTLGQILNTLTYSETIYFWLDAKICLSSE